MAGSIFRLISIRQENAIYSIKMTLCSGDEPDVKKLFVQSKRAMGGGSEEFELAKNLNNHGRFDAAEKCLRRRL